MNTSMHCMLLLKLNAVPGRIYLLLRHVVDHLLFAPYLR